MIRRFARPMLVSVFVADGIDALMDQKDHEEGVRNLIARVRSITPNQYDRYVPRSKKTVIQAIAGAKVTAGSFYALGKTPHLSVIALTATQIPTMLTRHAFWETQGSKEKAARRIGFLTDIGLLGDLFLATADTDGKPGVAWRAEKAGKQLNKKVQAVLPTKSETKQRTEEISAAFVSADGNIREKAGLLRDRASEATDGTREYVEENKGGWRRQLIGAFDTVKSYVEDNKDDWISETTEFTEDARDYVKDLGGDLKRDTHRQRKKLRKRAARASKETKKSAKEAQKRLQ